MSRIRHEYSCDLIELPASKQKDPTKQLQEESQTILNRLAKMKGLVFVLDERGEALSSEACSQVMSEAADRGDPLIFIIGGAYGLSDEVRRKADRTIKLSDMTLPHELCRIVFLEQLYRARQIVKGTGYHH